MTLSPHEIDRMIDDLDRSDIDPATRATVILLRRIWTELAERTQRDDVLHDEIVAALSAAYPDGDADKHRRYHEALIAREERRAKIAAAAVEKGIIAAALAMTIWIGQAVITHATTALRNLSAQRQTFAAPVRHPPPSLPADNTPTDEDTQ